MIQRKKIRCKDCGKLRNNQGGGLCNNCYYKVHKKPKCYSKGYKQPIIRCKNCKRLKEHRGLRLCAICYRRLWYNKNKKIEAKRDLICYHSNKKRRRYVINCVKSRRKLNHLKKPCKICGDINAQIHHKDNNNSNNKINNIEWLCFFHHKQKHGFLLNITKREYGKIKK